MPVGTRVQWKYNDALCDAVSGCPGQSVVFDDERVAPLVKAKDAIVRDRVFDKTGTFKYFCAPHMGVGMTGTLHVV